MKKHILAILVFLLIGSFFAPRQAAQANPPSSLNNALPLQDLPARASKMDLAFQKALNALSPTDQITVIVKLRQQVDLSKVGGKDHAERQRKTIEALQAAANLSQGPIKTLLGTRRGQGRVKRFDPLWVVNGFSITADRAVIDELALRPDVFDISPDDVQVIPSALGAPEPNIAAINAPALWGMGFTGQGVVVASMDSGVDVTHPDLASRWRGGSNSWFDPYGQHTSTPVDGTGHGTWTMGIMVGGDAGGTTVGVAPGAQWIAVKIFNDQGTSTATAIHQGYQWLLDPDHNPATADAPQVVNNSWSFAYPSCNLTFEPDLQALRAAGILPVFAAGNGGPNSSTSYSPANNPSAFAVGAVDNVGGISAMSSRGPSTCGGSTAVFPDVVAPGVSIRTTDLIGGYYVDSGTSFAAPHVTGELALLLSAYTNLTAAVQEQALTAATIDLGTPGPDNIYGNGLVDALAAYNWLAAAPTATPLPDTPTPTATPLPATDTPLPATATATPLPPTATATPLPPTATATPLPATATATPLPPTATPTSAGLTMHVGDLARSSTASGTTKWNAKVTILVHNSAEAPLANVTVKGSWSAGATGTASCVTNATGTCSVSKTGLSTRTTSVTFTITGLVRATYTYIAASNHDANADSNGTTIIVLK